MRNRLIVFWGVLSLFGLACTLDGAAQTRTVRKALPPDQPALARSPDNQVASDAGSTSNIARTPPGMAASSVYPAGAPPTVASSAVMIDARTGSILFYKNPDIKRPVASTQKLLTALLIAQHGGLDDPVRVTAEDCAVEPTKLEFQPGEVYLRRQLLGAMLVHSCNDAAACLARNDSGSVPAFARLMNAKAFELGAANSHFVNANGLPRSGQYSTARDMARIAFAAYRVSVLRQFMKLPGLTFTYASGRQRFLEPTNKLLTRSTMFTGMKTGYTEASGRCLVSSATNGDRDVILVQLGGTHHTLFDDAQRLLTWGLGERVAFPIANGPLSSERR